MRKKNELISIGEFSKITGAGIHALRYYERKNILKPAYTDPDSGYRYYSFSQVHFVALIMNCVELGIPLKEIADAIAMDEMSSLRDFMAKSCEAIEKKVKLLKFAADGFNKALQKMELGKQYAPAKIYVREFKEKTYYVQLCEHPVKERDWIAMLHKMGSELYGENISRISDINNIDDLIALPDAGCLCQYAQNEMRYYGFAEVPKQFISTNTITVPAGAYFFRQDKNSQIEYALEVFKKQLKGCNTFMIIETKEIFFSKSQICQPLYELRLVTL